MFRVVAVLLLVGALVVGGCGDDDGGDGPRVLTDPGEAVEIGVGDEVVIDLESISASTGFSWELRRPLDEAVLELVERTEVGSEDEDVVGAPGRFRMTLRAVGEGEATVDLWEIRPWEEEPEPSDEAVFTVTVS